MLNKGCGHSLIHQWECFPHPCVRTFFEGIYPFQKVTSIRIRTDLVDYPPESGPYVSLRIIYRLFHGHQLTYDVIRRIIDVLYLGIDYSRYRTNEE